MVFVAVLMGTESDWPVMQSTTDVLKDLGINFEVRVTSAHRTPAGTSAYVADAEARGCRVFICAAGMAAHLAGAVAAHTQRPVIGVPVDSGPCRALMRCYRPHKCQVECRWQLLRWARRGRRMLVIWRVKYWRLPIKLCMKRLLLTVQRMLKRLPLRIVESKTP